MTFFVMNAEKAIRLLRLFICLIIFLCVAVCLLIKGWLKGKILVLIWPAQAWFLSILARSGINPIGGIQVV